MARRVKYMTKKEEEVFKAILYISGIAFIGCGIYHSFYAKFALGDVMFGGILCFLGIVIILVVNKTSHLR